ncbi:flagellar basal body rod protein FlgG [Lysinibacillus sp. FSL H8-0500]|uniref:Flagellar hook protein FlgE n=1 Tax=Lysinibacillus macroides TaxID=33935 RepID=A0A0N0UWZ2_9BACI|nr:flagellar basal body rod protein FlgG [Lysinibacillus macroides]KOY82684.1 flagellar basal body rod protein FlgG [Lysinibacillus macroides]QPR66272.1 flagellar basal body rod protein FlgG [Lysinibacillus macroides]
MIRAMYSGISGLKNFQTKLDVIGNNIANVNTVGFKKGRVNFKDLMSQTQAGASAPTATRGGVNPKQVGLGSQLAAIDTIHGGGSTQTTGRILDLAIDGDGFFMVGDANGAPDPDSGFIDDEGFNNILFTRNGIFYMDPNGYLVNGDGKYLVGVTAGDDIVMEATDAGIDPDAAPNVSGGAGENLFDDDGELDPAAGDVGPIRIPTNAKEINIGSNGVIEYVDMNGERKWAGQLIMAKFPNAGGLSKTGGNYYQQSASSGVAYGQVATVAGMGQVVPGAVEMSNVDLSEEFTEMIVAQRGFQANTRIITTSDEILQELVNLKR